MYISTEKQLAKYVKENITKDIKIEILKQVKQKIKKYANGYICVEIKHALIQIIGGEHTLLSNLYYDSSIVAKVLFPELTLENARLLCKKIKVKKPHDNPKEYGDAFWSPFEVRARVAFINWLISKEKEK